MIFLHGFIMKKSSVSASFDFEKYAKQYAHFFVDLHELELIILRGHLIIEEILIKIISDFVFHEEFIKKIKLTFEGRINVARSISLDNSKNSMWNLMLSINEARNHIAHNIDSSKSEIKIDKIKSLYFNEVQELKQFPYMHWHKMGSEGDLKAAVFLCCGFLLSFHDEVKRFKAIVSELDKLYNPHRHNQNKS